MSPGLTRLWSRTVAPLLLVAVVAAVWCVHYGKLDAASWTLPPQYAGDGMEVLARMKAASEGDWGPFASGEITRLGAPFHANWRVYPEADLATYWLAGALARWIGLYPAANLMLLGAHLLAGLSFYGVARMLRQRREWAVAGGVLFACSYFLFFRSLSHLALTLAWTVPPALATCWLVARGGGLCARHRAGMLLIAVCLGLGSPYYLLLYLQLLVLALVWQAVSRRQKTALLTGAACLILALGAAVAQMGRRWDAQLDRDTAPAIVRDYSGTEVYSLKFIEMLLPPLTHRLETMRLISRRYDRSALWKTEWPSPYLGLAGIGGLLVLLAMAAARSARGGRLRPPGVTGQAGWILLFSMAGGLGNLLALVSRVHLFRATNRYSIFILAIALIVLTGWLSRVLRRWPRSASRGLAALLVAVGIWDQVPPADAAKLATLAGEVASDRELAGRLERRLPPEAAIFQLPVLHFPEARPPNRMRDYEHFRLYLNSDTLHFSYGPFVRRSRAQWQSEYARLPAARLAERLQHAGFAGIYVNRAAYRDHGEAIVRELERAGWTERIDGRAGRQTVIVLAPEKEPAPPEASELTLGNGWSSLALDEGVLCQTAQRGVFTYFNPHARSRRAKLHLRLSAVGRGEARVLVNGREVWRGALGSEPVAVDANEIAVVPGRNVVAVSTVEGASERPPWIRVHRADWSLLAD